MAVWGGRSADIGATLRICVMSLALALLPGCDSRSRGPAYSRDYQETVERADREGRLVIWSTTDRAKIEELLAGFRQRHPSVKVDYLEMPSNAIYQRFLADAKVGRRTADLLWSSAMDLQIKLVNDGYAQRYQSPERAALPKWANWKNQAWGITAEPIVMIYNRRLIEPAAAPRSHVELRRVLETATSLDGRIATYDPERSGVGYLYFSQDDSAARDLWRMVRGLGRNQARLFATTEAIIEDVSSGRSAIGYNVVGSYALDGMQRNPDLAVVVPHDYTLVMSRIAMIPAAAAHPAAARLFLDYLLSRDGQQRLAAHSMPSVRRDVPAPASLRPESGSFRAIRVGPALLVEQDRMTHDRFIRQWRKAIGEGSVRPDQFDPDASERRARH